MIFTETHLAGAFILDLEPHGDERGFFARTFCQREFGAHGINPQIIQANISFNVSKGTVRGLHFQFPPFTETKFVRCSRGAILDVIVDLRPESPTYLRHAAVTLSAENGRGLYVPQRFAHGYQVLEDDTEATYQVGEFYTPAAEGGLHHADPWLAIEWPLPVKAVTPKDRTWRLLEQGEPEIRTRMTVLNGFRAEGAAC
jgi:dTDP-4-dehydrorhamnose 3,5-epimerase